MKKLIFIVVVAVCFSTGAMAQGISGGIKAGLNFANQKSDVDGFSPDGRTGFHAGVFAIIKMGTLGLQPEILYNSVGADFDGDVSKVDYVSVPILVRFNFAKIVNIHVGPQFGMLLSAKTEDIDVKDQLKSTDLGIAAGVGLDLPMGLIVSARYVVGVSDINDSSVLDAKVKNNVLQLSVGYKLFGK